MLFVFGYFVLWHCLGYHIIIVMKMGRNFIAFLLLVLFGSVCGVPPNMNGEYLIENLDLSSAEQFSTLLGVDGAEFVDVYTPVRYYDVVACWYQTTTWRH